MNNIMKFIKRHLKYLKYIVIVTIGLVLPFLFNNNDDSGEDTEYLDKRESELKEELELEEKKLEELREEYEKSNNTKKLRKRLDKQQEKTKKLKRELEKIGSNKKESDFKDGEEASGFLNDTLDNDDT